MKTSILIATHGSAGYIEQALASVHSQSHADWELIVVDTGPPDETEKIVQRFAASAGRPVHFETLGESQGVAAARNRLLTLASGDAIAFLKPVDTWTPRHLANALPLLESNADLVISGIRSLGRKSERTASDIMPPSQLMTNPTRTLFAREAMGSISAVVLRRSIAMKVGRFDTSFRVGDARDFWLRCALVGARFAATRRSTCCCTRPLGDSVARALLLAESSVQFYEKHRDLAAVPAALRRRLLASSLVAHGRLLRKTDPHRAARCFWRAWSLQPVHIQTLGQYALTSWRSGPPGENPASIH
jgi:glycosyltransferase involved in cell wall biosynthesis